MPLTLVGKMQDSTTLRSVPSCLTLSQRWKTHVSPLSCLRGTRATHTADRMQSPLRPHRGRALSRGHLAHSRIRGSYQLRLRHSARVQSLALPAQIQPTVLLLRQHLPHNKTRGQRLARVCGGRRRQRQRYVQDYLQREGI